MDHTVSLKTRSSGIEVYRLICVFFVIEGHVYLQFFPHPNEGGPVRTWLLLTTLIVTLTGLNNHGFMTISGYFGVEQNWKKMFSFLCMIWIYSILTSIVAVIQGTKPDLEFIVNSLFPTATGRYWYATAYFILVLLSPYLNLLVSKADKKTFRQVALILAGLFIVIPTFLYYGPNGSYTTNWVIMI